MSIVTPRQFDLLGQLQTLIEADVTIKSQFTSNRVRSYFANLPKGGSVPAIVLDVIHMAGHRTTLGNTATVEFKVDIWSKGGDAAHTKVVKIADAVNSLFSGYSDTWTGNPSTQGLMLSEVVLESSSPILEPTDPQLYGIRMIFSGIYL